ncbi:small nuclear ribonucleoprotein-associated protein B-like [Teleopsis dalmanni]|uniref:small nuclear ribonucleoprotein-associated protein B-like n=1 Tax=Teleopsis dalmanni TaxID=139649 RepID=UPI0018CD4137|nr:small nuclear ribonucleoprotein-associated protein B-like [Teleopsis dalmanni]XP_037960947.1 small nuclear ribonucleoprotein-associated protein B-like [Teleopsis dalmanni]
MRFGKNNKMQQYVHYRVRVLIQDSRTLIGTFKSFDKHMNLILADCEEFRTISSKSPKLKDREEKRVLGFVLLRGEQIVSFTIEGPPPPDEGLPRVVFPKNTAIPGACRAAGRGVPINAPTQPAGLTGPIRGIRGPPPQHLVPIMRGRPRAPLMLVPPPIRGPPPPIRGPLPVRGVPPPNFLRPPQ